MGGGSKTTSTSQQQSSSGSGQTWANPYAVQGVNEIIGVYNANKDNLASQTSAANELSGKLSGAYDTAAGNAASSRAQTSPVLSGYYSTAGQPTAIGKGLMGDYGSASQRLADATGLGNQGSGYYGDVLSGKYQSGNPYLDAIINQTNLGVTDQVNSQFSLGGRYGSGQHVGVLTKELANADNNLRYGNYSDEMARMADAAGAALAQQNTAVNQQQTAGSLAASQTNAEAAQKAQAAQTALQQQQGDTQAAAQAAALALAQQQAAAQLPYTGTGELSQALSALFSGGTSSGTSNSVSKTSNGIGSLIGPALEGAAMFSDPRLKHDIQLVMREEDGLGWYEYAYNGSEERMVGVMADEVAELRPWALGPNVGGYMTVHYEAL